jgi:hypothetical protein
MASKSGDPSQRAGSGKDPKSGRSKKSLPEGVRGPRGPQGDAVRPTAPQFSKPGTSPRRLRFEQASYPMLRRLHSWPRWIIVVLPAILLVGGLILTGPLAWVGGIALLVVWAFVAWLTALSWPALSPGSKLLRLLVVVALFGVVVLKFLGRF